MFCCLNTTDTHSSSLSCPSTGGSRQAHPLAFYLNGSDPAGVRMNRLILMSLPNPNGLMANDLRPVVVKPLTDSSAVRLLFRRCFTYKLQSGRKNRADSAIFIPLPPDFICTNIKIVEMKADGKEDGGWEGRTQSWGARHRLQSHLKTCTFSTTLLRDKTYQSY